MKSVFLIAIVAVAMIGVMVPSSFAELSITADGGDCSKIGTWDSSTKTCTLNTNIDESIIVNANYVTLNGNNHKIIGDGDDSSTKNIRCISIDAKIGITIKNFKLSQCGYGIGFQDVLDSSFVGNEIYDNYIQGMMFTSSNNNIIKNNKIYDNYEGGVSFNGVGNVFEENEISNNTYLYLETELKGRGIHSNLKDSKNIIRNNVIKDHAWGLNFDGVFSNVEITNNEILDNEIGIKLNTSEEFKIKDNIIKKNDFGISNYMFEGRGGKNIIQKNIISENIRGIFLDSGYNTLKENTIESNSEYGIKFKNENNPRSNFNNKIFNNNFIDNSRHVFYGENNFFTVDKNGNFWNDFSSNCMDVNTDKICDDPYPFSSGTVGVIDTAVWVEKDGWLKIKKISNDSTETQIEIKPKLDSKELGIASFVDQTKDPQHYIDRYNNEPSYKEWFDTNYPQYESIEQAVGLELTKKIPTWIKSIFGFYSQDKISEDELLNAIQYLINEKILIVN